MKKSFITRIKEAVQSFGDMFREYPVTFAIIWILAVVTSIYTNLSLDKITIDLLENVCVFLALMCAQSLFVEEFLYRDRRPEAIPGFVYLLAEASALIISVVGTYIMKGLSEDTFALLIENTEKVMMVYCFCLAMASVYHMYKRQEENFETYCIKACCGCFKCSVIYGLFAIGLAIIILIFDALIADTGDTLLCAEQFLAIGAYGTMLLSCFCNVKEELTKFTRLVFIYVLQSILLIAFLIIYIYIFKIIFTLTLPSNEVYYILAFLFAFGMPLWTMSMAFNETEYENKFSRIAQYIPYAYMPFIVLQCICIGIRIKAYGITLDRYLGVALIVFEVLYFAIYILQRIKKKNLVGTSLIVFAVMCMIVVLAPYVNAFDVSIRSQMTRLDELMQIEEPSDSDKNQIVDLYVTINSIGEKAKLEIKKAYSEDDQKRMEEYRELKYYGKELNETIHISISEQATLNDISGYSTMLQVYSETEETGDEVQCYIVNDDFELRINVDEFVNFVAKDYIGCDERYQDYYGGEIFEIDDNTGFFCRSGFVVIEDETGKVTNCSLDGYVFLK